MSNPINEAILGLKPLMAQDPSLYLIETSMEEISFTSSSVSIEAGESGGVSNG